MKRLSFLAIVLLAFAFAAPAQDAMKKDAAKPADPEVKVVLDSWIALGRSVVEGADAPRGRKSEARPIQVQGRHRFVRQEILRRWRHRHPGERRKRHDDGGCLF